MSVCDGDGQCGRSLSGSGSGFAGEEVLGQGGAGELLAHKREMSSTELRGRWLTTCWACPAALLVTVTTTLVGSPRTCAV